MAVASLNEIARRAGVSPQTVSRVLRGGTKGLRSDAVARSKAVFAAAEELGYRPNGSARAMQRGRFNALGWVQALEPSASSIPTELMAGVQDAIAARDYHLVLARLSDAQLTSDQFVPKVLQEFMVDGLLMSYTSNMPDRLVRLVAEHTIPTVWLNVLRETDAVRPNDRQGGRLATERLLRLGHKRIWFTNFEHDRKFMYTRRAHYSLVHRYEGYLDAMKEAGLEGNAVFAPFQRQSNAFPQPPINLSFLEGKDRPTALVGYSGYGFFRVQSRVEQLYGDKKAISLATFGSEICVVEGEGYDTVITPEDRIGHLAVEMLMRKVENPKKVYPSETVPCELRGGLSAYSA
jgi:LacI family transcriptional regulator